MLKFLVIIMLTFTLVEAAHLNYHVQQEVIDSYVHDWPGLVRDNRAFTAFRRRNLGYLVDTDDRLVRRAKLLQILTEISEACIL